METDQQLPLSAPDAAIEHHEHRNTIASPRAVPTAVATYEDNPVEDARAFECNVCLELAKEPIVTLCGHLYCWPCLYRWTQGQCYARGAATLCPVCKAGVDIDKVIPIYGRGSDFDPREGLKVEPVPPRPVGQRPSYVQPPPPVNLQQQQQQHQSLSALLGFNFGNNGYMELTPEQQHQAFMSRLLLLLGSFVIMCLLLF